MIDFDVWTDDDGNVTATEALSRIVNDEDAPYGYCHHAIRLTASGKRDAMAQYRLLK